MTTVEQRPPPDAPGPASHRLNPGWSAAWLAKMPKPRFGVDRAPKSRLTHLVTWVLLAFGFLLSWLVFYALAVSSLQHFHDQGVKYAQIREQLALGTIPLGGQIAIGKPVAVLDLPAAGLHQQVIVEGTSSKALMTGPGHRRDTAMPGEAGVSVIYGRAKLFGGPFHSIAGVKPGATITVTTGQGIATYIVERVRHAGDPFPLAASGTGRLTLVTAESSGWRAGWAPTRAVYVDAAMTSKAFPDPGGRPSAVPKAEIAMSGDSGVLYLLVLWLPVLAFAAIGAVWAQDRWGRWQTWIVGVPVVLAGLWGVSQSAVQLLPNLM